MDIVSILILIFQIGLFLFIPKIIDNTLQKKLENYKKDIQKELDRHKIEYSEIQLKKIEYFNELMGCYIGALIAVRDNKDQAPEKLKKLGDKISELKPYLFIYASDKAIKEINKQTEAMGTIGKSNYEIMAAFADLVIALRKDVGYEETLVDKDDLLKMILAPGELEKIKV